jgi:hypothetical protein
MFVSTFAIRRGAAARSRVLNCAPYAVSALTLLCAVPAHAQTFGMDFVSSYTFVDLGTPASVPGPLGGINFDPSDSNILWLGGSANNSAGAIYSLPVTRDIQGHITAFASAGTLLATAPNIDGGMAFGPNGVLFVTTYSDNQLLQFLPGAAAPSKTTALTPFGINSSVGTCQFVPVGFAGAGTFKVASYSTSDWYDVTLVPDGLGTFDLTTVTGTVNSGGGPEGIVYIGGSNPGFNVPSMLVSEYSADAVRAYDIDANGDPLPGTQREFLTGLSGAEGAVIDPVTGDFLFSTFGGGDRVIVVRGFSAPAVFCTGTPNSQGCTPTIQWTGAPSMSGPDNFAVSGTGVLNGAFGLLMHSAISGSTPLGNGILCLTNRQLRLPVQFSGGTPVGPGSDCTGGYSDPLTQAWFAQNLYTAGTTVYIQYLSRDGGFAPPNNLSLSDGLRFTILP